MNETQKIIEEIDALLHSLGDPPLSISGRTAAQSELQLLQQARDEYTRRLRQKMPLYRLVPARTIPDLFLQALNSREAEIRGQ